MRPRVDSNHHTLRVANALDRQFDSNALSIRPLGLCQIEPHT